jgi:hypothetical protein
VLRKQLIKVINKQMNGKLYAQSKEVFYYCCPTALIEIAKTSWENAVDLKDKKNENHIAILSASIDELLKNMGFDFIALHCEDYPELINFAKARELTL